MKPIGYIRVSREDEQDARTPEEQRAGQVDAIQRLAARDGYEGEVPIADDWDRSADPRKEHRRVAFTAMLDAIEAGEVTHVYARSLDRLYRSMKTFVRLTDLCDQHNVRIVTEREGVLGGDGSPMARAFAQITGVFAELELDTAKARSKARVERQRIRMDVHAETGCASPKDCGEVGLHYMGQVPYGHDPSRPAEDPAVIVDAFREAGSYKGAARLLAERSIGSRRGLWHSDTVRDIVMREASELVPTKRHAGSRTLRTHTFTRMLVCPHDGSLMTSRPRKGGGTTYLCRVGDLTPGSHPRPYNVTESVVTGPIRKALQHVLRMDMTAGEATDPAIKGIRAKLERYAEVYAEGDMTRPVYEAKRDALQAEVARLESLERASMTLRMGLDWRLPPGELNASLRDMVSTIRLGYITTDTPVVGRHKDVEMSLVPTAVVTRMQPTDDETGEPDLSYERVDGGWLVPLGEVA